MRLWFVRHGETEHNVNRIFQGQLDTLLTKNGLAQAVATAEALQGLSFSRIVASDLRRAFDTAECICAGREISVETDVRLRELHYGVLQGVAYHEFHAVLASHGVSETWGTNVFSIDGSAPPGGETLDELVARTSAFIEDVVRTASEEDDIAVVTHGGTIRTITTELLGMPPESRFAFSLSNCGVTCFTRLDDGWRLEFHNRVYWGDDFKAAAHTV